MSQSISNTIEIIFIRNLYQEFRTSSNKNEILSNVIQRYQQARNINSNDYKFFYNQQELNLNSTVGNLKINDNNEVNIEVMKNMSNSSLFSSKSDLKYSMLNKDTLIFEGPDTLKILVDNSEKLFNAMNDYEAITNSKGQNNYFVKGKQIDPYKSLSENGISSDDKIIVKKKNDNILQLNNEFLNLNFKNENPQDIITIQAKYSDYIKTQIVKYLSKSNCKVGNNNQQIENNKYSFYFNKKRLIECQTVLQSGLVDGSEIIVKENDNKNKLNIVFSLDSQKIVVDAFPDDTVGELIRKFEEKKNFQENNDNMYIYNSRMLNVPYKSLREEGIVVGGAEVNVVQHNLIGAK